LGVSAEALSSDHELLFFSVLPRRLLEEICKHRHQAVRGKTKSEMIAGIITGTPIGQRINVVGNQVMASILTYDDHRFLVVRNQWYTANLLTAAPMPTRITRDEDQQEEIHYVVIPGHSVSFYHGHTFFQNMTVKCIIKGTLALKRYFYQACNPVSKTWGMCASMVLLSES
jgi:hypothetical protein